ncbi:MAG: hypothetical protein JWN92_741 [Candidatus Acidoferrum typicum]|jgi:hypothetical protein|nr:hypothetical protein [Candidatus Acidoferrum typicum]
MGDRRQGEFQEWFAGLTDAERISVARKIDLLEQVGPAPGRPDVDHLKGSHHPNMKELRVQHAGDAYRILFAFDPRRVGILLLGGRKADKKWYKSAIAAADKIYKRYLEELGDEGLI